jgi:hypothetical protein
MAHWRALASAAPGGIAGPPAGGHACGGGAGCGGAAGQASDEGGGGAGGGGGGGCPGGGPVRPGSSPGGGVVSLTFGSSLGCFAKRNLVTSPPSVKPPRVFDGPGPAGRPIMGR